MLRDLRSALRLMHKNIGATSAVLVTLAIGLGLNTAVFSVLNALLIRELPYARPDRIVRITPLDEANPVGGRVAGNALSEWRQRTSGLLALAGYDDASAALTQDGEAVTVSGAAVSASLFDVLGASPLVGRPFLPDEEYSGRVVILSHALWQQRFSGRLDAIGRTIDLDGASHQIVGVMKPAFVFPTATCAFWIPLNPAARAVALPDGRKILSLPRVFAVGRLRDGATQDQIRNEALLFVRTARDVRVTSLHEHLVQRIRPALLALQGGVGVVVLIVCANVAVILLARGAAREREMAVRSALGGRRVVLVRQLLLESGTLALAGAALGLLLAWWSVRAIRALNPGNLPQNVLIGLDSTVLVYSTLAAIVVGLICGLLPATRLSRIDMVKSLRATHDTPAARWTSRVLVCSQVSLALVLVSVALTVVRSFLVLVTASPGYDVGQVATADVGLTGPRYVTIQQRQQFYARLLRALEADPSLERTALASHLPLDAGHGYFQLEPAQDGNGTYVFTDGLATKFVSVSHQYFDVMKIPVLRGRGFLTTETETSLPVVVLSESAARRAMPARDPIGSTIKFQNRDWHIVGVAGDVREQPLAESAVSVIHVPYVQLGSPGARWDMHLRSMSVVARSRVEAEPLLPTIRRHVEDVDRAATVDGLVTMQTRLYQAVGPVSFYGALMTGLAVLALALAAVGIFGLLTYAVTQRTREIGIRLAIGADRLTVFRGLMRDGLALVAVGATIGVPLSLAINQALRGVFHGVQPAPPWMMAVALSIVGAVALVACAIPARVATRVDPLIALRSE